MTGSSSGNATTEPLYCGEGMDDFHTSYKNVHGYVSLAVCILGTIANTLNIIVLSRREMRSPTNAILTGLAVADLAVMLEYIPYTIHDYILFDSLPREQQLSYPWACFIKFHSIFAQVLHTISIWLTVTLAVWRYIAVGYPQKNRVWCGMRTTMITITTAYVVCVLVVSPSLYLVTSIAEFWEMLDDEDKTVRSIPLSEYVINYYNEMRNKSALEMEAAAAAAATMADPAEETAETALELLGNATMATMASMLMPTMTTSTTTELPSLSDGRSGEVITKLLWNDTGMRTTTERPPPTIVRNVTVYRLFHSDLALHNTPLRNSTFLIYSVVIKLIPCIALTILSVRLILALLEAKRRRKKLTSKPMNGSSSGAAAGAKPQVNGKPVERPRKNSKTLEKEKQTDRTTRMLLAVLLLFLITEFPQGIMGLLNTILGDAFLMQCYMRLSDVMDILALINSSINFILYCTMSKQFRTTFTLLFRPKFLDKWLPVAQDEAAAARADGLLRSAAPSKSAIGGQHQILRNTGTTTTATTTTQVANL